MVDRTIRDDFISFFYKSLRHHLCIFHYLACIFFKIWLKGYQKATSFRRNNMLQPSSLHPRKNTTVQDRRHHDRFSFPRLPAPRILKILPHHDHTTAWTSQGFMGRTGHDMTMRHRIIQYFSGNQSGWMSYIRHQKRSDLRSEEHTSE